MFTFYGRVKKTAWEEQQRSMYALADKKSDLSRSSGVRVEGVMARQKREKDRRIQKTQKLLHEALGSLIREKPYEEIVVKEILDRANVGRSTFYMHFRDKDELLTSVLHEMLRTAQTAQILTSSKKPEGIMHFSLPLFEHIHRQRHMGHAQMGVKGWTVVHQHLRNVLALLVADDESWMAQTRRKGRNTVPRDLFAQHVASTFVLVLNWWVETKSPLAPKEINEIFRLLICS